MDMRGEGCKCVSVGCMDMWVFVSGCVLVRVGICGYGCLMIWGLGCVSACGVCGCAWCGGYVCECGVYWCMSVGGLLWVWVCMSVDMEVFI